MPLLSGYLVKTPPSKNSSVLESQRHTWQLHSHASSACIPIPASVGEELLQSSHDSIRDSYQHPLTCILDFKLNIILNGIFSKIQNIISFFSDITNMLGSSLDGTVSDTLKLGTHVWAFPKMGCVLTPFKPRSSITGPYGYS